MSTDPDFRPLIRDPDVLRRMEIAFDLYETAERMKRQNILRANPEATEEEIEKGILQWLHRRPGAEHGDSFGRPVSKERLERLKG